MGFVTYVLVTGVVLGTQQRLVYTCSMSYFPLPHSHPTCAHTHTHTPDSPQNTLVSQPAPFWPGSVQRCWSFGCVSTSLLWSHSSSGWTSLLSADTSTSGESLSPPSFTSPPSPPSSDTSRVASCITVRMVEPHPYQKFRDATNRIHTSHSSKVLCSHNTPLPSCAW